MVALKRNETPHQFDGGEVLYLVVVRNNNKIQLPIEVSTPPPNKIVRATKHVKALENECGLDEAVIDFPPTASQSLDSNINVVS